MRARVLLLLRFLPFVCGLLGGCYLREWDEAINALSAGDTHTIDPPPRPYRDRPDMTIEWPEAPDLEPEETPDAG